MWTALQLISTFFGLVHQFGWLDIERGSQLEDRSNRRLVLPRFNQGDEIALNPRLQPQLFLAQPRRQPMLAQNLPKGSMR